MLVLSFAAVLLAAAQERSLTSLAPCQTVSTAITRDWKTIQPPESGLRLRLPPGMTDVKDPKAWCIHGCEQWARGSFTISISHGAWSPESFDEADWASACVEKKDDLTIVKMQGHTEDERTLIIWPVQDGPVRTTNEIVVSIRWLAAADTPEAAAVASTLQRIKPKN